MINSRLDGLPMTYSSWISFYDRSRYVIFFAVFLFLSFQNTNAQVISTTAGGNWNAGATWIGGIVPAVGQDVVIDGPVSLNVNTPSIASLTINSGDTFTTTSTFTVTVAGAITVDGTYSNGSSGAITKGSMTVSAGGSYFHARGDVATVIPLAVWANTSTCRITASVVGTFGTIPTGFGQTFGSFIWDVADQSGNLVFGATPIIAGDFSVLNTNSNDLRITNDATNRTISVAGNFSQSGTTTNFIVVSGTGTGVLNVDGNFSLSGGTFVLKEDAGAAALNVIGNFTQAGGTFDQRATNNTSTGIVSISGNFSVSAGTYDISGVGAIGTLNVTGDFSQTGGTVTQTGVGGSGLVNLLGNFSQTAGAITETSNGSISIAFNGGGVTQSYTSGGTITNTINFVVNGGSYLQMAAAATTLGGASSGTFTLSSTAKFGVTSAAGISTTGATGNIRVTGTRTYASGANYIYNGSTNQNVGNGLSQNTPANIEINNFGNIVSLGAAVSASGTLTITAGVFNANTQTVVIAGSTNVNAGSYLSSTATQTFNGGLNIAGGTFTGSTGAVLATDLTLTNGLLTAPSGNFAVSGNWIKTGGTFTPGTNTVTFTGAGAQTLNSDGSPFRNISHSGSGTLQVVNTSLTTSGTFTNSLGTFDANGQTHIVTGLSVISGGSYLGSTATQTFNGGLSLLGGTFTGSTGDVLISNLAIGNTSVFSIGASNLTVIGTTQVGSGSSGSFVFGAATGIKTFVGMVTLGSGSIWDNGINSDVFFQGGILRTLGTFTSGSGNYTFDTNSQSLSGVFSIPSVTVNGISLTNNYSLTVATALSGTGSITQSTNSSLVISGTSGIASINATNTGNTVSYNGLAQAINQGVFHNLIVNQSGGTNATLGGDITINNNLTLNAGRILTGVNVLKMASGASAILGATTTRFIVGNLEWALPAGASTKVFEIGTTVYGPITLVNSGVTGTVTVIGSVTQGNHPSENTPIANSSGIDQASKANHYWTVTKSGSGTFSANAIFDFSYTTNTGTPAAYVLKRYESSPNFWTSVGSSVGGSAITSTGGLSAFGDFQVGNPNAAPSVSDPVPLTVCQGVTATFTVTPLGVPSVTYQWRKGAVNISGATSASLIINPVSLADAGNYDCVVSNVNGSATSATALLTVNPSPTLAGVLQSSAVCEGNGAEIILTGLLVSTTFTVDYSINSIAQPPITGIVSNASGVATFTTPSLIAANNGELLQITGLTVTSATPNCTQVFTQGVTLSVNALPTDKTVSSLVSSVCGGSGTRIEVLLSSVGVNYQLRNNADNSLIGAPVAGTGATISLATGNLAINTTYNVLATTLATGCSLQMSIIPIVNLSPLPVVQTVSAPGSTSYCLGTPNVTVQLNNSEVGFSYELYKNGIASGTINAGTGAALDYLNLDAGVYTVYSYFTATPACGTFMSGSVTVIVNTPTVISVQPTALQTLCESSVLNLSVSATGTGLSYQWNKDGTPIFGATASSYNIPVLVSADAGTYTVEVTSGGVCGNTVTSSDAVVNVNIAAVITTQPLPATQTLCLGSVLPLNVVANGSGPLSYQWKKNGVNISGATTDTYSLASVGIGDGGNYSVEVTSSGVCVPASVTSNIALVTIESSAVISVQPTALQTLCESSVLNLSVSATGTGLSYQWNKDGTPIFGATSSSYSIPALVSSDAGIYTVEVTSGGVCGNTVTSSDAVVNVNIIPLGNRVSAGTYTECSGNTLNITPTSNVVNTTFSWLGSNGSGGTGNITDTPINNTNNPVDITYTISPLGPASTFCLGSDFSIVVTIKPLPIFSLTKTTPVLCEGLNSDITINSPTSGTLITLTSVNYNGVTGTTGYLGGETFTDGQKITESYSNPGSTPITVTYTFSSAANGCSNPTTQQTTVVVNPDPVFVITNTAATICEGAANNIMLTSLTTNAVVLLSSVDYNGAIGGNYAGGESFTSGQKITETLINPTESPITVTYTFSVSANGCSNLTSQSTTVSINPAPPVFSIANATPVLCEGVNSDITINSSTSGAVMTLIGVNYNGVAGTTSYVGGETFINGAKIIESYSNPGDTPLTVTYTFASAANGCSNLVTQQTSTVVNPDPIMSIVNAASQICSGSPISITLNSSTSGAIITLANVNYNGVIGTLTSPRTFIPGSIITEALVNTSNAPITVTYSFTVAGNGCSNASTFTTTVAVNPNPTLEVTNNSTTICSGTAPSISFNSPTSNASIALQSVTYGSLVNGAYTSGDTFGAIGSLTEGNLVNNTNNPIIVTYTFSVTTPTNPVCPLNVTSQSTTVTVLPTSSFTVTNSSPSICTGSQTSIMLNTTVSGVQVRLKSVNYGTASGSLVAGALYTDGQSVTQILTNSTNSLATVTYEFESLVPGCAPGASQQITVQVKPKPVIMDAPLQLQQTVCSGTPLNFIPTSTTDPGTTNTWTSTVTGTFTGITSSGSGAITDVPVNTANTVGFISYTLTPEASGCSGSPVNYVVTVSPVASADGSDVTICSGQNAVIIINAGPINVSGTTFSWVAIPSVNVSGAVSGNGSTVNQVLTLTDFLFGTVTYQITPSSNSCTGLMKNVTVSVNPIPTVDAGADYQVCEPVSIPVTGSIGGAATTGTWLIVSGAGSISASTVSGTQVTATYTVAPTDVASTILLRLETNDPDLIGPCSLVSDVVQIQINRRPTVTLPADFEVCEPNNLLTTPISLSGVIGGSATTALWSVVSGSGILSASTLTGSNVTSLYTIAPSDIGNTITLRLTTNDSDGISGPCVAEFKQINIRINRAAVISAGSDLQLCEDSPSITLQGVQSGASTLVVWSGGSGVFSNSSSLQPVYSFSNPSEINTSLALTITALDPDGAGPCQSVSDQMILIINPLPGVVFTGLPPGSPSQMVENNPPITLTGNNVGGVFTISPSTSVIGSTTVNVVDRATFDPSAVDLGSNFITYTFTNANGCTNSNTQEVFVNPVTDIDFGVQGALVNSTGEFEICANLGDVKLLGFPPPVEGYAPETKFTSEGSNAAGLTIINIGADYFIKTDGVVSNTYRIRYTFKNQFGGVTFKEKSIRIFASPVASFSSLNNCIKEEVVFTDNSSVNPTPFSTTIDRYEWNFGDGFTAIGKNQSKRYNKSGTYRVTLKVTTFLQGCSNTSAPYSLRVGDEPIVDFDWSSICNNDQTKFQDNSDPGTVSSIDSYIWDFGDGTVLTGNATLTNPEHKYVAFGTYNVKLKVLTNDGCENSLSKRVFILPYPTVAPVAGAEYLEGFELTDGGWIAEAFNATNSTPLNIVKSDTSWIWGSTGGSSIVSAAGGSNFWWTGDNSNTYFSNENSVVNGPCFNLTQLKRPMIALDYFSDSENNLDGAVLQYSTEGGIEGSWTIVGPELESPISRGINWFNGAGIFSNPGSQPIGNYGWTDKQGGWKNARFNLDIIPIAKRGQVRFRMAFSSNDGNASGNTFDGFAFDNFFVGEKKRNVLVEHFTAATLNASLSADSYLNNLLTSQITPHHLTTDFYNIQYHVNFPGVGVDGLNKENPADPAARALYYGVSQPPYSIMDGLLIPNKFTGVTTELNNLEVDRRALADPQFELALDTIATSNGRTISVELKLKALKDITVPLIAHVALVEDDLSVSGFTNPFKNVLRQQLFGSDGETISMTFVKGQEKIIMKLSIDINTTIVNSSKLILIGFVQDKNSKEIYQSIVVKAPKKNGSPIVGVKDKDPIVLAALNSIQLFPNPANGEFYFGIPEDIQSESVWQIIDQRGISVLHGDFSKSTNGLLPVNISTLSNAMYYVVISAPGGFEVRKKVMVMNRN